LFFPVLIFPIFATELETMRVTIISIVFFWGIASAQQIDRGGEFWVGYISSVELNKRIAVWNDAHLVPQAFWLNRHGLTYRFNENHSFTGGYAYVRTATSFTRQLVRDEHRPFFQFVSRFKPTDNLSMRLRYRHDFRFRRDIEGGQLIDDFMFYHRLRFMADIRRNLKTFANGNRLQFTIMNELLFNAGSSVQNQVDQNRLYALLDITFDNFTVFFGYHWRHIPNRSNIHGCTFWVSHTIKWKPSNTVEDTYKTR
jgi:hypothetical protein